MSVAYDLHNDPVLASRAPVRTAPRRVIKHVLSTRNITIKDVDDLCHAADDFEAGLMPARSLAGKSVALLFFQSSTRTRIGFETAAVTLGAHAIGLDDMSMSRSNQKIGESLEDCAAVVSRLADAIVVRHHEAGTAARMAQHSVAPIINAGDGWNEHPTQALIDIYAMRRGLGSLRGKSIAFCGDPRGRVIRSLLHLLRFESPAEIVFCAPAHRPVPEDMIASIMENQIRYREVPTIDHVLSECDAVMMGPHDYSSIGEAPTSSFIPSHSTPDAYAVDADKLARLASRTLLYHPLPRYTEIDPTCDALPNAQYFEQVRLSKFMRMAILEQVLTAG